MSTALRRPIDFEPERIPAFQAAEQSLCCDFAGVRLVIADAAAQRIVHSVEDAFAAVRQGAETGGLLLGRVEGNAIAVDEVAEVSTEYRYGPTFRLSPTDVDALNEAVRGKVVVGFYRSHTRGVCALRDSDFELFRTLEARGTTLEIVILITPSLTGPLIAELLLGTREAWAPIVRRSFPVVKRTNAPAPNPSDEKAPAPAASAESPGDGGVAPQAVSAAPPAITAGPAVAPVVRARRTRRWLAVVVFPILVGAAAIGGWALRQYAAPAARPNGSAVPAPSRERLGFSAMKENGDWKLTWNPDSTARLASAGAELAIEDGGAQRLLTLTGEDLATGTAFYTPRTSDIVFILRAKAAGRPDIEERIRVLGAAPLPSNPVAQGTLRVKPSPPEAAVERTPDRRAFVLPPIPERTSAAPAALPAPPSIARSDSATTTVPIPAATSSFPGPPPVAREEKKALPAAQQERAPVATQPSPPPPGVTPPVATPPAVMEQTPLNWPRLAPSSGTYEVQLRVEVNPSGRVTRVTPADTRAANTAFVESAVASVRSWKFRPASVNGHAVPGEILLTLRFHR